MTPRRRARARLRPVVQPISRRGGLRRGLLLASIVLAAWSIVPTVPAAAQSPSPTIVGSGDPRSEGEGAGFVGSPVLVALAVIGFGVAAAGATLVVVRLREG